MWLEWSRYLLNLKDHSVQRYLVSKINSLTSARNILSLIFINYIKFPVQLFKSYDYSPSYELRLIEGMWILLTALTTKRESLITKPYSSIRILNFVELMGRLNTGYLLHLFLQRISENLNHSVFWKISRLKTLSCLNSYHVVLRDSLDFKFKNYYFFFHTLHYEYILLDMLVRNKTRGKNYSTWKA